MKIGIIKLGADGDVLRTLPLAIALKKTYKAHITWITKGDISSLLKGMECIDELEVIPYTKKEKFDKLYNFDLEEDACNLAEHIVAGEKFGFYRQGGYPVAYNSGAEYYLNTVFDDALKKENKKTYQEMMFMVAELPYTMKEIAHITLTKKELMYAREFGAKHALRTGRIIGLHMGASSRWPSKVWSTENVKEFIIKAKKKGYDILLFGGPNEKEQHTQLVHDLTQEGINIAQNNPMNTKREFAALVDICGVMVCSDSLSLHVSLCRAKETVGLFFCTSPDEVEDYNGMLTKIVSPQLYDFFPERMNEYNEKLVNSIRVDDVLNAVMKKMLWRPKTTK